MFILNDQSKQKLGLLIEYYRGQYWNQTRDKKWQKNNFLLDEKGIPICSDKTYYKIMKGEPLLNDEIYDKLLAKLNENFVVPPGLIPELVSMIKQLIRMIEFRNEAEINIITKRMLQMLRKYKNIIYYREIYEFMHITRDYYVHGILMSNEQYEKYCQLISVFYQETQTLIKSLLFRYCHYAFFDYSKLRKLYVDLKINEETAVFHRLSQLQIAIFDHALFEARNLANEILQDAIHNKNDNIEATVMAMDLMTTWLAEREQFECKWNALSEVLFDDTKNITKNVKSKCFINIGLLMYCSNHKEQAYQLFRNAILYNPTNFHLVAIYLRHIEDVLDLPKISYTVYEQHRSTIRFQTIYQYYILRSEANLEQLHQLSRASHKQKEDLRKLEMYLYYKVVPVIHQSDIQMIKIFLQELNVIATLLQSYTTYRKYITYFQLFEEKGD